MGEIWESQLARITGSGMRTMEAGSDVGAIDESPDEVLADRIAEALRGAGCGAANAARYAVTVMGVVGEMREPHENDGAMGDAMVRVESIIREMLRGIIAAKQPRVEAKVNLMARGVQTPSDESMRALAEVSGYTVAAISKMVARCQTDYALPQNQFNKSAKAKGTYRETNKPREKL